MFIQRILIYWKSTNLSENSFNISALISTLDPNMTDISTLIHPDKTDKFGQELFDLLEKVSTY